MPYTLMTAAQACGINRSTVLRAIKAGRVSATKDEVSGAWLIEPAEMHRLYPPVEMPDASPGAGPGALPKDAPPIAPADLELHLRASLAEQRLSDLKGALDDMRDQRDRWQHQAERLAAGLLTDQRPKRRPWWRRIAG